MTETQRPTQEEREWALDEAQARVLDGKGTARDRVLLALAAENKALEERVRLAVRSLGSWMSDGTVPYPLRDAARDLLKALAADDAKAAGEPECEHPTRATRFEDCQDCGAGPHLLDSEDPNTHPAVIANVRAQDRASRRRAYVREHASRFLEVMLKHDYANARHAIEQAGLIFDETEQP